jgi:UDP-N-acetylglucosamine/UDP-N-acetylgalactosamine diphosphorylase
MNISVIIKNMLEYFKQEMAPSVDYNGKIYMEEKWKLSMSPNGNGGWFSSMAKSGLMELIHEEEIEWLNVFSVDNVLQKIADPVFVGAVLDSGFPCGGKVIQKADPYERVGVMCREDGKPSIVEYYELTEEMANQKDEAGNRLYEYGVTRKYLFRIKELEQIMKNNKPLQKLEKKIPYMDEKNWTISSRNKPTDICLIRLY